MRTLIVALAVLCFIPVWGGEPDEATAGLIGSSTAPVKAQQQAEITDDQARNVDDPFERSSLD